MYTTIKLITIRENGPVTRETHADFFFELQRGVLLSLREMGKLTQMQYRNGEKNLEEQRRAIMRAGCEGGSAS